MFKKMGKTRAAFHLAVRSYMEKDSKIVNDLNAELNTMRDEWQNKFIMGLENPADDATWKRYLDALKRINLDTFIDYYKKAYEALPK